MELAKVTSKGQITIPVEIRELLKLKEGSKVLFFKKGNDVVIKNSALIALEESTAIVPMLLLSEYITTFAESKA